MLPRVILHNSVSLDGRIDWFTPDIGLHYEIISVWQIDAHLVGSDTILRSEEEIVPEEEEAFKPPEKKPGDKRFLLVVPDSRGRVRKWHMLRKAGLWRRMVALCSDSTPKDYLDYLKIRHIDCIVAGEKQVDMRAAFQVLNARFGVRSILLDSGGTLNGVLLRAGLVSEVSLLLCPCLVGGTTSKSFFRAPDLTAAAGIIKLNLIRVDKLKNDTIWLRYQVVK